MNATYLNEIHALKKNKFKKKKRDRHPPLPSQPHKGRNGQRRSFQFPSLSLLTSGEREEEAPVNEVA